MTIGMMQMDIIVSISISISPVWLRFLNEMEFTCYRMICLNIHDN